jgi:N-acetylneuraminate synthase/N,N'-diacetyllegionaminate synthase
MNQKKVLIIAEAGVNHNGDLEIAKKLIECAATAGADYVKFQTFKAGKLVSKSAKKAIYQQKNTVSSADTQISMLEKLEIPDSWYNELISHAKNRGISLLSTGFDEESIDFLDALGMRFFKIPSGELTNKPYLMRIASKGKPVILSTGMATLNEIEKCLAVLIKGGIQKELITVLHCNTEYPTPMEDVNLLAMRVIGDSLSVDVGYSDHTLGIEVPIAAVALGAKVIEKHFTLSRTMEGPDHLASLEPDELTEMVSAIRNIEMAISGSGYKEPSNSEIKNIQAARKSIHVAHPIPKGAILNYQDLIMKRPGDGISPMEIDNVIGKKIKLELDTDDKLKWEYLEE